MHDFTKETILNSKKSYFTLCKSILLIVLINLIFTNLISHELKQK